jgi:L-aminopeptidase/D-esterase-like protein
MKEEIEDMVIAELRPVSADELRRMAEKAQEALARRQRRPRDHEKPR